jgi:hypothetical protein
MTKLEQMARAMYAASCALHPIEPMEPDWGRGGYKTQVMYWHGLAQACLSVLAEPDSAMVEAAKHGAASERAAVVKWLRGGSVPDHSDEGGCPFDKAANAIERGEHLQPQKED